MTPPNSLTSLAGVRVLVTGHTGFKGSWLALWLKMLGAKVGGFSIGIPSDPSHYELIQLTTMMDYECIGDIRNLSRLKDAFDEFQPELVFHLAAEPIVSTCINDPKLAFDTNLGGTVNVLECLRHSASVRAAVIITSDKCYENVEWEFGYRETDRLGGKDPYSSSKACAEIAFSSYFRSYFSPDNRLAIATARAGNVIGGGDWAKDRIVADAIRSISKNESLLVRSPSSTRPWQLVLEPLSGYLWLAVNLLAADQIANLNGQSFNFGPKADVDAPVGDLLLEIQKRWPALKWTKDSASSLQSKEAGLLKLNCDKALRHLRWSATLDFGETMDFLTEWYRAWNENKSGCMREFSQRQIQAYQEKAKSRGRKWMQS